MFEPRSITLAHEGPGEAIVASGLAAGEKIVAGNVLLLAQQWQALAQDATQDGGSAAKGTQP